MYLIAKPKKQDINMKVQVTRERERESATSGGCRGGDAARIFKAMLFF